MFKSGLMTLRELTRVDRERKKTSETCAAVSWKKKKFIEYFNDQKELIYVGF